MGLTLKLEVSNQYSLKPDLILHLSAFSLGDQWMRYILELYQHKLSSACISNSIYYFET